MSVTTGNGSYSISTASAASSATYLSRATTATTGSPLNFTLSTASGQNVGYRAGSAGTTTGCGSDLIAPRMSSPVTTATTPGMALRGACVNPLDAGMGVLASHENKMQRSRNYDIGEILTLTSRQPIVFFAIELPANPTRLLRNVIH